MIKKTFTYIIILYSALILSACSSATGSRYSRSNDVKKEALDEQTINNIPQEKKEESFEVDKNFDMTLFRAKIEIDSSTIPAIKRSIAEEEIWYSYEQDEMIEPDSLSLNKTRGYRVEVFVTDNLEEANNVRSELYFITNQKQVYVSFEPPFYKVKVGDYTQISEAKNLQFKLNQMGYSESRVISEEVNIYQ